MSINCRHHNTSSLRSQTTNLLPGNTRLLPLLPIRKFQLQHTLHQTPKRRSEHLTRFHLPLVDKRLRETLPFNVLLLPRRISAMAQPETVSCRAVPPNSTFSRVVLLNGWDGICNVVKVTTRDVTLASVYAMSHQKNGGKLLPCAKRKRNVSVSLSST